MILRLIDSPSPSPSAFVVKKSNTVAVPGSSPVPESHGHHDLSDGLAREVMPNALGCHHRSSPLWH